MAPFNFAKTRNFTMTRFVPVALTALALGFAASAQAADPIASTATRSDTIVESSMATTVETVTVVGTPHPLTRAEVRESTRLAKAANLVTPNGDIGDSPDVLQAREDFYALQTEVLNAQYAVQYQAQLLAQAQADEQNQQQMADSAEAMDELTAWLNRAAEQGGVTMIVMDGE